MAEPEIKTSDLPLMRLDWSARRFSHCQASEDECTYEKCPRWRDGKIFNKAHCALDLIGMELTNAQP